MPKKIPWKRLKSKIVYETPWLRLRMDKVIRPDGKKGIYGLVETPGPSVFIAPLTNKNEVYLLHQYRYPTKMYSWEIPAGNSDNQKILEAAKRELREETGLVAKKWQKVGVFQTMNGICNEIGHVFIAKEIKKTEFDNKNEEGIFEIKKVPFKKTLEMIKSGEITDCQTIAALMQVAIFLNNPFRQF